MEITNFHEIRYWKMELYQCATVQTVLRCISAPQYRFCRYEALLTNHSRKYTGR